MMNVVVYDSNHYAIALYLQFSKSNLITKTKPFDNSRGFILCGIWAISESKFATV